MVIRGCGGAYGVRCRLAAQNCHCRPICVLTAFNNGAWNRIAQLHSHYMFFFVCVIESTDDDYLAKRCGFFFALKFDIEDLLI